MQTQAYMRAVMERSGVNDEDAEVRVAARAGRQTVLSRKRPPRFTAILDESVFHRSFGGDRVMAQQVRHIRDLAELPNITVQVIPFHRGGYPIFGPYVLLQFNGARDIVHLEHKQASGFLDEPDDTAPFHSLTDTLKVAALEPAATLDFLRDMISHYERQ
jgi:hypothetical protein